MNSCDSPEVRSEHKNDRLGSDAHLNSNQLFTGHIPPT